jgi:pterin-4a-carbinolamine dehydratase
MDNAMNKTKISNPVKNNIKELFDWISEQEIEEMENSFLFCEFIEFFKSIVCVATLLSKQAALQLFWPL